VSLLPSPFSYCKPNNLSVCFTRLYVYFNQFILFNYIIIRLFIVYSCVYLIYLIVTLQFDRSVRGVLPTMIGVTLPCSYYVFVWQRYGTSGRGSFKLPKGVINSHPSPNVALSYLKIFYLLFFKNH